MKDPEKKERNVNTEFEHLASVIKSQAVFRVLL